MSEEFKKYKDNFMVNNFYNVEEIPEEEYNSKAEDVKEYYYTELQGNNYKYFKKTPEQLSNEELNSFLQIRQFELTQQMDNKQNTIKNIMIFWMILTIINLIGSFYIISKIGSIF